MVIKRRSMALAVGLLLGGNIFGGDHIWVGLYNNLQVRSVVVSAYNGSLTAFCDGRDIFTIDDGQAIYAALGDGKIWVYDVGGLIGSYDKFYIRGSDSMSLVRLRPVLPQAVAHNYEDFVWFGADVDRMQLLNCIDEERYIAGVVEAEVGRGKTPEFYKAKAIICRTYLYGHIGRHENEGFHLCDEVHCQAYKGQCKSGDVIRGSVVQTSGIILIDRKDFRPILAAYHSNCGGTTESARNAWQNNLPYLIPVTDPYCNKQPNAHWKKNIALDDWLTYLVKNGFKPDPNIVTDFGFEQQRRQPSYEVNDFSLSVKHIRNDWQLKSTFFSIAIEDGNAVFYGRGYGHGVGLCQEGAMEMGRRGYKYDEIINFYYKYVDLIPVLTLQINKPIFDYIGNL